MSLNDYPAPPLARPLRLDRIEFGIQGRLSGATATSIEDFRIALAACTEVDLPRQVEDPKSVTFYVILSDETGQRVGRAMASLHFRHDHGDLVMTERSRVRLNPIRITRGLVGPNRAGPPGLDGKDNILSPALDTSDVPGQHDLAEQAFAVVCDAIQHLLPGEWHGLEAWLKAAELCVDMEVTDAVAAVRKLQRSAITGSIRFDRETYRTVARDVDSLPVCHWYQDKSGLVLKAYAKGGRVTRCEVGCPSRASIWALGAAGRVDVLSEGAALLTRAFETAAAPLLLTLVAHAEAALADDRSLAETVATLGPLVRVASGQGGGRGPKPTPQSRSRALTALDALLTCGMHNARAVPKEHAVRKALDELVTSKGLTKHAHRAIYYVAPAPS